MVSKKIGMESPSFWQRYLIGHRDDKGKGIPSVPGWLVERVIQAQVDVMV